MSCGNANLALHLLRQILDLGGPCKRDVVSYSTVISVVTNEGEVEHAQRLFEEMTARGIKPNVIFYIGLIREYSKLGNSYKVVE